MLPAARPAGPCELSQPGFPLWSALLAALSDYLLVHVTRTLTAAEGLALVTTVFVAHGLACDLTGRRLDYTRPVAQLVHKVRFGGVACVGVWVGVVVCLVGCGRAATKRLQAAWRIAFEWG